MIISGKFRSKYSIKLQKSKNKTLKYNYYTNMIDVQTCTEVSSQIQQNVQMATLAEANFGFLVTQAVFVYDNCQPNQMQEPKDN